MRIKGIKTIRWGSPEVKTDYHVGGGGGEWRGEGGVGGESFSRKRNETYMSEFESINLGL